MKQPAPRERSVPATRVLMVDDSRMSQLIVEDLLHSVEHVRFELECCSTYREGLAVMTQNAHDICLVDYRLDECDGLTLAREAKAQNCRIPVIILTGDNAREVDLEAMRSGVADYLVKGEFESRLLERSIRYAIERSATLDKLRESEERYALAVQGANEGIWDWKLGTNEIYFSPRWKAQLGYDDGEFEGTVAAWYERVHVADLPKLQTAIHAHVTGEASQVEIQYRMLHRDGHYRFVHCRGVAILDERGQAVRLAGSQSDVTNRAAYDELTGLPNRSLFLEKLEHAIARARRRPTYIYAVLFLDLDRFKVVNDSLGHLIGDELLVAVARRIRERLRFNDVVARLGGDEFAILLDDIEFDNDAARIAERVLAMLKTPLPVEDREIYISGSIGVVLGEPGYERPEELLRDAGAAMNRAKTLGRGRHVLFDAAMHARAMALLQLEADLRQAVEAQSFEVFYQPIVSLEDGSIIGFEALVRWRREDKLVPPLEFIPLAEETGLIVAIDRFVLREACRQVAEWQQRLPETRLLRVNVNLSRAELRQAGMRDYVVGTLAELGFPLAQLTLEITESVIMNSSAEENADLIALQALGVQLALDDFGTGYSSLGQLAQFPVESLKIDRMFTNQIQEGQSSPIVEAILALASKFAISVTAEGVETPEQRDQLRALGCKLAQGYLFSRPLPGAEAGQLLNLAD